jgi:hypothetical protein
MKMAKNSLNKAIDKMQKKELKIEEILDDEELVTELKSYSFCQLMNL